MKYDFLTAISLLLISCAQPPGTDTGSEPSAQGTPSPAAAPPENLPQNVMAMRGVDLYMHDYEDTDGELRDPTFWIHADAGQLAEGEKAWSLQKTKAVIYREDGEDLHLEALEGQFDQDRKEVILKGEVRLTTGSLMVDLEDLVWKNEENTATSDHPVHLTDGDTRLEAQSLVINVEEGTLSLGKGSGYVRLAEPTS